MKKLLFMSILLFLLSGAAAAQEASPPTTPPADAEDRGKKPETAEDFFTQAVERFQNGDLAGAERHARTAIGLRSHYLEAHYLLGRVIFFRAAQKNRLLIETRGADSALMPSDAQWQTGQSELQEAVGEFRIVIKLDPSIPDAWLMLATCLDNLGQEEEAGSAYKQTILLDPLSPTARDAHNNLGLLYKSQKEYEKAKAEFNAALDIDPTFSAAQRNLEFLKKQKPGVFK